MTFGLISAALIFCWDTSHAQDKTFQTEVLQKLNELDGKINELSNRLNEMDKRYEVRFTAIEAKLEAVNQRIDAVNQRIDDKFNLIVGLLTILVAILALPAVPKLLERFKAPPQSKEDIQRLENQIEQIKTQLAQLSQAMRPTP
jgi:archaellum component FlaC